MIKPASSVHKDMACMREACTATPVLDGEARLHAAVSENYAFLWRNVRRFGVAESSVEDVMQRVFMTFADRIDQVAVGSERSYLFGIAYRAAADWRKTTARRREVFDEECIARARDMQPSPEGALHHLRDRELLDELLSALSDDLRVVFVLHELEEMTAGSIAELLGIPAGTVASRLRRARERFKQLASDLRARMQAEEP